jgi:hypothetical protein
VWQKTKNKAGGVAKAAEHKRKTLSSNPSTVKNKTAKIRMTDIISERRTKLEDGHCQTVKVNVKPQ